MHWICITLVGVLAGQVAPSFSPSTGGIAAPAGSQNQRAIAAPQGGQIAPSVPPANGDGISPAEIVPDAEAGAMPLRPRGPASSDVQAAAAQQAISPAVPPPSAANVPAVAPAATPAAKQAPGAASAAGRRTLPPEMVAEALKLPADGAVKGRPLTLVEALSPTLDRRRQTEVIHAYWRLAEAVAAYHYSVEENFTIQQFQARLQDAAMLETAKASAAAAVQSAEVAAVDAQADLAEAVSLPANSALPLPADAPHVGPYRTYFVELFAARSLPARMRWIDRTLPICRRAIDVRSSAVHAAEDASEGATDAYRQGGMDFPAVLSAMGQLGAQRRALMTAVCRYNHEIADYALSVASPGMGGAALVGMLIRSSQSAQAAPNNSAELTPIPESLSGVGNEVRQASHNEPVSPIPSQAPRAGQPTLAPPRSNVHPEATPSVSEPSAPTGPNEGSATSHRVQKPSVDPTNVPRTSLGLYPGLVDMSPAVRAKELSDALHGDRGASEEPSQPISLDECLSLARPAERRKVINAYWLARQKAGQYQVRRQAADLLEQLEPLALEHRLAPSGALAMLRLRAEKLAVDADVLEAHTELLAAQCELTAMLGRPLDSVWLLPSTPPHAGPYLLKLEAQPPAFSQSWRIRRLAAAVPALINSLHQRATAVVSADSARAAAVAEYQSGRGSMDRVLCGVRQQTDQTLVLLDMLTDYNESIAEYALAVLPSGAPANLLIQTLVVK